jgi:hypothetical protein
MWTKGEFDRFTYESVTAGQGGISKKIGALLDEYHSSENGYKTAFEEGKTVENTLSKIQPAIGCLTLQTVKLSTNTRSRWTT